MQLLTDKQIEDINNLKSFLDNKIRWQWNEVCHDDNEDIAVFLAANKIQLIMIAKLTESIGLEPFCGKLPSNKDDYFDTSEAESVFSNCIISFYYHIMSQLGYNCTEVDVDDVYNTYCACQVEDSENVETIISDIAKDYGVDETYIEMLLDDEYSVVDATFYIWDNNQLDDMIALKPSLMQDAYFTDLLNSVTEPIFMGYENYNGSSINGKIVYYYLLGSDNMDYRLSVNGLDYFVTDVLDAILLYDYIQKF